MEIEFSRLKSRDNEVLEKLYNYYKKSIYSYFIVKTFGNHAVSDDGKEKATELVNQYMNVAIHIAIETGKTMFPLIINNWKKNLIETIGQPELYRFNFTAYRNSIA